ncbi:MAG: ribonuclease M5 [Peptococcaceae bacterium]|nr:ribonuclease M5 [Peptococcaceae bacterium]
MGMSVRNGETKSMVIEELIVVEGINDAHALRRALGDVDVIWTHGFGVTREQILYLRRAAQERGVLVCTDPDRPGQLIRDRIDKQVPGVRHIYLSKETALNKNRAAVGVEYASPEIIREAFAQARPSPKHPGCSNRWRIQDLTDLGLNGHPQAALLRRELGKRLHLGDANAKQFVHRLNVLRIPREELLQQMALCSTEPPTTPEPPTTSPEPPATQPER